MESAARLSLRVGREYSDECVDIPCHTVSINEGHRMDPVDQDPEIASSSSPPSSSQQSRSRSRASSFLWGFLTHSPPSSPPKHDFKKGHYRTPSVPIPAIKINSPAEADDQLAFSSDGDLNRKSSIKSKSFYPSHYPPRKLERSVSSGDTTTCITEEHLNIPLKDKDFYEESIMTKSEEFLISSETEGKVGTDGEAPAPSTNTLPKKTRKSGFNAFLYPWIDRKMNNLAPPQRQRSKSYSDLYTSRKPDDNSHVKILPELTLDDVKEILMRSSKYNKGTASTPSSIPAESCERLRSIPPPPPPMPPSPLVGAALLPAASVASLDVRINMGMKNLKIPQEPCSVNFNTTDTSSSKSSMNLASISIEDPQTPHRRAGGVGRPRMLSQPSFLIPDSIHTAPILFSHQHSSAMKFFRPYFRRASQISTQGLILAESMVSLTNRALVSFIVEDNFPGLQHLLESRRVVVDDRDESGSTALMVAASRGKSNFVRALLEHGADINAEDGDNWSALLFATKEGHDEIVADLLDHGAMVDHRDMGGWTPLMWTCYKGRTKSARLLIEKGADVNAYGNYNVTCLGWAAGRGHTEITKDLLQRGAKVNVGDKYGTTALIWAARKGYIEIVDMLLNSEANVDACGMTSWTPLLVASAGNHVEVVKAILEHKPNVNALDKDGCSALTIACKDGFHEIAVSLINHGAYININDRGGTSNLIHAAKGGHRAIVESLLKKHADVNVQGKDRKTALYWAVEKSHVPVVKLILSAQPDLELSTKDGDSPLMKAVRNRNSEIVSLLLDKRAKVSVADKNGDTCLHIAMRARSKQIVELILRNPAHSQLLYRPNRSGETPYNIDRASPKPIIPQIFGSRGLNTQEDGENLLGYNLYSSALADMLSDPTLNMPITVGLFARWGSGKSFLLSKLREEMKSFARQWLNPVFSWNILILVIVLCFSAVVGIIAGFALQNWIIGASFAAGVTIIIHVFLFGIWFSSRRSKYDWSWSNRMSSYLATKSEALKLVCQVIFCHPPGSQSSDQLQAQPINFYFTEQTKISSTTGGENSVVQMLGSLYSCIENDYGVMSSRLYRAFRPKPVAATADWKWRKLCCIPYCVIFLFCFACTLVAIVVLALYLTGMGPSGYTTSLSIVMYACALIVGLLLVANIYTVGQVLKAIVFSHRRHLQRTISKLYAVKAEGFLNALKSEVNLMTDMIHCLDAFTYRQTRMVVIVDGLDSAEQEKVLQVLDAVHILFSDVKAPFVILLAIDPHIITKGIEMNINPVLNESNIGGHDYLRNLVHLPFFLQNAALRKVKHVKMLENSMKRNSRLEDDPGPQIILSTRRPSVESGFGIPLGMDKFDKSSSKKPKRLGLKMSESIASSLGSNLNKVTSGMGMPIIGGPSDLKKMLLGDDYFSDVNPRSMRRLMNIIHITGRLLKCFSIDFNWYHLSAWVNVTEQWPYRLSWIIIYCEHYQKDLDDGMSLKSVYERVKPFIPTSKDIDANVTLDRDEKKLDIYLGMHKGSLLVSTLYVFLPFTISLDPQLRKDITELYQPVDQIFKSSTSLAPQGQQSFLQQPFGQNHPHHSPHTPGLRYRGGIQKPINQNVGLPMAMPNGFPGQFYPGMPNMGYPPNVWYPPGMLPQLPMMPPAPVIGDHSAGILDPILTKELRNKKLSSMNIDGVCDLLVALTGIKSSQLTSYQETVRKNNINGRVLLNCDIGELKLVLQMTFGDWEMFKAAVQILRESESKISIPHSNEHNSKNMLNDDNANNNVKDNMVRISVTSPGSPVDKPQVNKAPGDALDSKKPPVGQQLRPNVLEKQVTMEEQMICGALELLNDEAKEDALKGEDSSSTLSPINSEPEPTNSMPKSDRKSSKAYLPQDETDVLYVMGTSLNVTAELPDSPSVVRKLSEAEARYSVVNENLHSILTSKSSDYGQYSTSATSAPISIPGHKSPGKRNRPSSFSKNLSFSDSVQISGGGIGSPIKSQSLGAKDYSKNQQIYHPNQRSTKSPGKDSPRKVSRHFAQQQQQSLEKHDSSSDASSDESQKPLVMKPLVADKYSRKVTTRAIRSSSDGNSLKKKRVNREDSIASKFSRIKSSFFGPPQEPQPGSSKSVSQPQPMASTSSQMQSQSRHEFRPVRYDLPTEDSSEPSQYFKDHGQPWTAYRTPTPLPPFGTDEYYNVIKSNNPSPTTSNESEIGSTPEDISSKEDLFLPGPPDLPESPYPIRNTNSSSNNPSVPVSNNNTSSHNTIGPGANTRTISQCDQSSSFVPVKVKATISNTIGGKFPQPQVVPQKSKKYKGRTVGSSGEEAVARSHSNCDHRNLMRRSMNQSDPVLSTSSSRGENNGHIVNIEMSSQPQRVPSTEQVDNSVTNSTERQTSLMGSPPLLRQSAVADQNSSRENTPQK